MIQHHDKDIRIKAVDDFAECLKVELNEYDFWHYDIVVDGYVEEKNVSRDWMIDEEVSDFRRKYT